MFGDELSHGDCAALLGSLSRTRLPLHCAHGRPTAAMLAPLAASAANAAATVAIAAADADDDDDDDELTPAKRRKMLARRAKKEWRKIRTLVERAEDDGVA